MSATTTTASPVEMEDITSAESKDLIALETVIERGLETFVQVGEALAEIRDRKLYRIAHTTFADYCKVKWKMSDRRARQLMDASEVVTAISKSGTIVPKTESQARPLASLPPEQRAEAWSAAASAAPNGQPTAKDVEIAVEKMKRPLVAGQFTAQQRSPRHRASSAKDGCVRRSPWTRKAWRS